MTATISIPERCDICGREWNTKMQFYPDGVACIHDGPCKGHPEGEACQYYYAGGRAALRMPS